MTSVSEERALEWMSVAAGEVEEGTPSDGSKHLGNGWDWDVGAFRQEWDHMINGLVLGRL